MDAVAEQLEGRAKVFKADVADAWNAASRYNIAAIPALLFFKNGELADQMIGAQEQRVIQERLERLIDS